MFVIFGKYRKPIEEVDRVLPAHKEFLDKYYAKGVFVCSGAMKPREGGVIICNAKSRDEVDVIMSEDPFFIEQVTDYSIIEFTPTKACDAMHCFLVG